MKKLLKILGWCAGSSVVLVILLVVGLRLFLPAEKLRDLAVARASAALGREVTVEDVQVSLRGGLGVRLTGVGIGNPAGLPAGHLMTAESVDLKLRLRPLFARQLHADRLVITAPQIFLIKLDADRNNFTFTAAPSGRPASGKAASESADATLNLERFECSDGVLSFHDEEAGTGFELKGLRLGWTVTDAGGGQLISRGTTGADSLKITGKQALAMGPLTLDHSVRLDPKQQRLTLEQSQGTLADQTFTISAETTYDPEAPVVRAEIGVAALDLAALLALLPRERTAALNGVQAQGTLDLRAMITFDPAHDDTLNVEGSFALTGGRLELPDTPEPFTDISATASFDRDALHVTAAKASMPGLDLAFNGTVKGLKQPAVPMIEGVADVSADLAGLQGYLPAERKAIIAGKAAGSIRLAGRLDTPHDLLSGGEITVTDLRYRDATIFEPLTDLDASVTLGPRDVTIKSCRVTFQPSNFALSGVIKNLVPALLHQPAAKPHLDFTLNAPLMNVDHLFPAASPGATPAGAAAEAARPPVMPEFPDFTGKGTVTVANLIYGGVAFTGITGNVAIADRAVTVHDAAGAVYAGRITGQTTIDLKDMNTPGYRGSYAARGIQADSLLSNFTPLKSHVFGALDFSGTYAATGKDPVTFRRSLSLDAQSAMSQGRLVTSGVIQQGMSTLAARLGRTFDKEEKLKDMSGPVKVAGERVLFDRLTCEIPGLGVLNLGGSYGFTGDLDFRGDLLLSEENSCKLLGSTSNRLTDALGSLLGKKDQPATPRLSLPLKIGGAFTRPDVALDFSALARASGQEVVDELRGTLEGMFRK